MASSVLTIVKIILLLTVIGLFIWALIGEKNKEKNDYETFKYGKYMIYLLVLEVGILIIFDF
ncbi:hypothetical protein [Fervidibacillus halotolerans]|uniref:Uncharacterized protein n=1 Tax=Fervidibacillus halotolerans TaxID=2980027 RepID=A0A9E8RZP6_9BACI|nr:hypothetical protein [Fervidibacillus halotolerans]WAA13364.1 hypothetical protein OE105_04415 [Fervidibacillus halotolerans]